MVQDNNMHNIPVIIKIENKTNNNEHQQAGYKTAEYSRSDKNNESMQTGLEPDTIKMHNCRIEWKSERLKYWDSHTYLIKTF